MAYAKDDIERIRQATNLVELIGATTTVKKTGRSYKAICPFHQEKTPSLSIDPAKGVYYCFGCTASGDIFTFVEETQGLNFTEAVEQLAQAAGVTLRRDPQAEKRRGERAELIESVGKAADFYTDRLKQGGDAGTARAYLRKRGYDVEIVDRFGVGYAPEEWDTLISHLQSKGVKNRTLLAAGLAHRNRKGRLIDYFRGRILFPIYDLRGDPVGFGGRKLSGEGPKYLNTPETRLYQKARLLYGLNWAKADITRQGYSLVVEGYTDVIGLHLAGFPTAVATCGTALGDDHFDLLRRFADRVVLAFDADEAGANAAARADDLEVPSDLSLDLRVALMPKGRDPADLVQAGDLDLISKAVDDSQPLLQFRIDRELDQYPLDEPEGRARAVRAAAQVVARTPDLLARREYGGVIARRTGVDQQAVLEEIEQAVRRVRRSPGAPAPTHDQLSGTEKAEREFLRLLIANDATAKGLSVDAGMFGRDEHRQVLELVVPALERTPKRSPVDVGSLLGERRDPVAQLVRELAVIDRPLPDAVEVFDRLERSRADTRIEELRLQLGQLDPSSKDYSSIFEELIDLERDKRSG